jgi:hypothetical protein
MRKNDLLKARRQAAWRQRRLILDDDGDLVFSDDAKRGPGPFLEQRFVPVLGRPVDSIAWCIMWGIAVGKGETTYWQTQQRGEPLNDAIADPTPIMADAAREHDVEIFGSIRMNDTHDAFFRPHERLDYHLKLDHPEWLLGDERMKTDIFTSAAALYWSALDYAVPQVRDDRLWWVRNTAESHDLDGIDLNFFRIPYYFKPGAERDGMPVMTEFVRSARRIVDEASEHRGRPLLLGVRTPGTVETCMRIGLDVETWLKEGLVDRLLIGGGYVPLTNPAEELVALGHEHDVPVYPCINCGAPIQGNDAEIRAAASNILWAGADGIYLWNYQYRDVPKLGYGRPVDEEYDLLDEIGSVSALRYRDKSFSLEREVRFPAYARACHPAQVPAEIAVGGRGTALRLRVGDDVAAAERAGRLAEATLRLELEGGQGGTAVEADLNGAALVPRATSDGAVAFEVTGSAVRQGDNQLLVRVAGSGRRTATVQSVSLDVSYR